MCLLIFLGGERCLFAFCHYRIIMSIKILVFKKNPTLNSHFKLSQFEESQANIFQMQVI